MLWILKHCSFAENLPLKRFQLYYQHIKLQLCSVLCNQEVLVGTVICTAKATEWTRRLWARLCSTTVTVAALVSSSNAPVIPSGATQVALPSSSLRPISVLPTSLSPVTMADGATLLDPTSILPCLCFSRSPSIAPESSPSLSAGNKSYFYFFNGVLLYQF